MPDVLHEHTYAAAAEKIREAIVTEEGLSAFWTDQTKATPEAGSTAVFGFGPDHAMTFQMRVETIADDLVEWTCVGGPDEWVGTRVRWRLRPGEESGTTLRFEHLGWESTEGALGMCSYTWAMILDRLERYLATGEPQPFFALPVAAGTPAS